MNSSSRTLTVLVGHVPQLCLTASDAQGQHEKYTSGVAKAQH